MGTYAITASGAVDPNYTIGYAIGTLSVTPASLTVTANPASRTYGAADPAYADTITGFVLGQTLGNSGVNGAASFTSNDTAASPVGTYTISVGRGTLAAQNYIFSFVNGTENVTPATLAVSAIGATRIYGSPDPTFLVGYSGFALGQTLGSSGVTGAPSLTGSDTAASPVGSYTITAGLGTLMRYNYVFKRLSTAP